MRKALASFALPLLLLGCSDDGGHGTDAQVPPVPDAAVDARVPDARDIDAAPLMCGDGVFAPDEVCFTTPITIALAGATSVVAADFDGDGDVELASSAGNRVSLLDEGVDGWVERQQVNLPDPITFIVVVDATADVARDVVAVRAIGGATVLPGSAAGFQAGETFGTSDPIAAVASGLLDGEKTTDLVAVSDGAALILSGNGAGVFVQADTIAEVGAGRGVAVADITGDGLDDIVFAGADFAMASALLTAAQDDAGFSDSLQSQAVSCDGQCGLGALLAVNLDGDGRSDVVASLGGFQDAALVVYLDGNVNLLSLPQVFPAPARITGLASGNLLGDADADIAAVVDSGTVIALYRGRGNTAPTLDEAVMLASEAGFASRAIATADLNGDGRDDIATAGSSGVAIYFANP
jgi:hypothetical protein